MASLWELADAIVDVRTVIDHVYTTVVKDNNLSVATRLTICNSTTGVEEMKARMVVDVHELGMKHQYSVYQSMFGVLAVVQIRYGCVLI